MTMQLDIESLLENASLTSNLDDRAANTLLEWGADCVRLIYQDESVPSLEQREDRLRDIRRLMRAVNSWARRPAESDSAANPAALQQIIERAAAVYGTDRRPEEADLEALARLQEHVPVEELIGQLRRLFE